MKKYRKSIYIMIILFSIFLIPNTKAKTLSDLKVELAKEQADLINNKEEKQLTQAEMAAINSSIKKIQNTISENYKTMEKLNKEINSLSSEINEKKEEIKKVVNFAQVSSGESAYLEYIFGSEDFTDFIYRSAVAEQLASYNSKVIIEYNQKIELNKQKATEIEEKKVELSKLQDQLAVKYNSLGSQLQSLDDIQVDIQESINVQKEIIKMYEEKGCKDNENISTCGKKVLPSDTRFWRPINIGKVTSNFGYRTIWGRTDYHTGVDLSKSGISGKPVYSTANGTVAALTRKYRCGGNMVYIHHYVNGRYYTSLYMHLRTINVSVGQTVNKNTVIGLVGGDSTTPWDSCSTGSHVHFTLLSGLVGKDYYAFSARFYSNLINPRSMVNFPSGGKTFENRLTAY